VFFVSLLIFSISIAPLPWWSIVPVSVLLGWWSGFSYKGAIQSGVAAGLAWSGHAFFKDGQHYGLISRRMSGVFQLPYAWMIFVAVFLVAMITVFVWFQAGGVLRELLDHRDAEDSTSGYSSR
jgi:hypothetical protein